MTNFKANLNAMKQIKLSQRDTIVGKSSQLTFTYAPVEREFCLPQTEIQTKFTYSGIVLEAEATLSLDSFFFIALEAIFAWISRIFKRQKLICVNESKALLSRQPMRLDPVLHGLVSSPRPDRTQKLLPVDGLFQENCKFWNKKGDACIRLGAEGPSNALWEQKNREKVNRERFQWLYCVLDQFDDVRFMIKAPIFSRQGFEMISFDSGSKHTVILRAHIIFFEHKLCSHFHW